MTTEIEVVVNEEKGEAKVVEVRRTGDWEGKYVKPELNERTARIASQLADLGKENETGKTVRYGRNVYYKVAEENGLHAEVIKDVESFNQDYATAVHALHTDRALGRFLENKEQDEYGVTADIGEHTRYRDNARRFDSRSVMSGGPNGERRQQETYGYHNPVIRTEYKNFEANRQSVHTLARDLLGG